MARFEAQEAHPAAGAFEHAQLHHHWNASERPSRRRCGRKASAAITHCGSVERVDVDDSLELAEEDGKISGRFKGTRRAHEAGVCAPLSMFVGSVDAIQSRHE